MEHGQIDIHAQNILPIIKKWLYSDKDIFVRELVANACDAVTKHRALALSGQCPAEDDYRVIVSVDKDKRQLRFADNGIGMTADEVRRYINQVAFSGAQEFLEKYKQQGEGIIGHFGLGFYSSFMVAERVHIDTRSFAMDADPVHWTSEDGMTFDMEEGARKARGTTVTLELSEGESEYLQDGRVKDVLRTYCAFMPVPIYLEEDGKPSDLPVNDTKPLWLKSPKDCTDEEYKAFYKATFQQWEDPLFYIHLAVEYPLNLRGILYFPRIHDAYAMNEGQVKLYCNQVFVADNIKEIIPEFLLLLRGVIDCPDLPLNVSRSFLQNDGTVKKLSAHITKKVADRLETLFSEERSRYEACWSDIAPFVKYGCMREDKFYERMQNQILLKDTDGAARTMAEALERAKDKHDNKLVYTSDASAQAMAVTLLRGQGVDVYAMDTVIDGPFMNFLEMKREGLSFLRVDADLTSLYEKEGGRDEELEKAAQEFFRKATGDERLNVRLTPMKDAALPATLVVDEQMRRMSEMSQMYGRSPGFQFPVGQTLVLNPEHEGIAALLRLPEQDERALSAARQVADLCALAQGRLAPERMEDFLRRSFMMVQKDLLQ